MPRPKNLVPTTQKTIQIPEDLLMRIELLAMNPVSGKMPHGFFSELCNRLLRTWVRQQIEERTNDKRPEESNHSGAADPVRNPGGDPSGSAVPASSTRDDSNPPGTPAEGNPRDPSGGLFNPSVPNVGDPSLQGETKE